MRAREFSAAPATGNVSLDAMEELAPRGSSANRRVEIVSGSARVDGASGSASIKDVNLCLAACFGIRASSDASRQGSRSSRASAERTLSSIPFFSSPIGANRKASNSDPRDKTVAECFISTIGLRRPRRRHRPTHARAAFSFHPINDIAWPLAMSDSETTYDGAAADGIDSVGQECGSPRLGRSAATVRL